MRPGLCELHRSGVTHGELRVIPRGALRVIPRGALRCIPRGALRVAIARLR